MRASSTGGFIFGAGGILPAKAGRILPAKAGSHAAGVGVASGFNRKDAAVGANRTSGTTIHPVNSSTIAVDGTDVSIPVPISPVANVQATAT